MIKKFITHSKKVLNIAINEGWFPGARYTNLRDIKSLDFENKCFIDIDWKNYSFEKHLEIVSITKPYLTIARDIISISELENILKEAECLKKYAKNVALVPKDINLSNIMEKIVPKKFMFAYSVPSKYGGTKISTSCFKRKVHLLGGRPDKQRQLANQMNVISIDCNRFTFDAKYGDYFNGNNFQPHPFGGYEKCLIDSIKNINKLWSDYYGKKRK